jgi:predicted Rossmann fold nucleotide-binding protein DprA/Smf involved in DNA uptake
VGRERPETEQLPSSLLSVWQTTDGARGVGNAILLDRRLTAFFASRQCSGAAIRAAMDWVVEQARSKSPTIGGFHSPLEKSVLEVLLAADVPVVIVIARSVQRARFPSAWRRALQCGTAAVVSMNSSKQRLTSESAARRNNWVASHATHIVLAHASTAGKLVRQAGQWEREGHRVDFLAGKVPSV